MTSKLMVVFGAVERVEFWKIFRCRLTSAFAKVGVDEESGA